MTLLSPDAPVARLTSLRAITVRRTSSLRAVAGVLASEDIGAVVIERPDGAAGILTERDIVRAVADGADLDEERAADRMTFDLDTVTPSTDLRTIASRMLRGGMRHVLVLDGDRTSVVSMRDVLAVFASAAIEP